MKKQKGIVLFFSLIILLIMTVIGVALAVNSNQSIRMAGAGSERVEAMAAAHGAQDSVIATNAGTLLTNLSPGITPAGTMLGVTSTMSPLQLNDVGCQRNSKASSANLISCRRSEIISIAAFGRNNLGQLTIVAGVEQEVLTGSAGG
ncbi:pilus assembly PilX N-terminal domain-containing protein [Shewanella benthica]|uniref:pilus assembly PilX family protein n=1 Tax=Shewanella benthica TaxID=43661 RepID=UPI00187AD4A3|nr:pilus assembly PilX N-terminal domain-containing protein [Shewanella benthica]MBE7215623.1 pilus assembly PilX N-terminal domain-containing protein [Shewanella benthica]MCL1062532.1 pilus assembly PilX N-terminal domain-containing protein [Shewanella benthica]